MRNYDPKDWFHYIFSLKRTETFRKLLPMLFCIAIYSLIITYLIVDLFQLSEENPLKHLIVIHNLLGVVISLLLAYRTNTAYERWWEGRKLWGSMINNSRSLSLKLSVLLKDEEDLKFFRDLIPKYAITLQKHLRDEVMDSLKLDEVDVDFENYNHVPNQIAKMMFEKVNHIYLDKKITGDQYLVLNDEVISFIEVCGACERIKNTPIPYSYSSFIKKFVIFYVLTLPLALAFSLSYLTVPVVVFVFYILASLELIAEEIEDPFGTDANNLPTRKMANNIKNQVEELI